MVKARGVGASFWPSKYFGRVIEVSRSNRIDAVYDIYNIVLCVFRSLGAF